VAARLLPAGAIAGAREGSGPPTAAGSGGTRPDVTISIGHIEVRAAPPVGQPRARRPFRPQVSLDDFLSQQQDGRR
jgi:hypothetical protein